MAVSEAQKKATAKYNLKSYDRYSLMFKKGRKEELKTIAESLGESLNTFINKAIDERIEREV